MTVIRPNSVSGINSITAQADEIKVFKSNGTQGGLIIGGANLNATTGISTILALNVTGNVSIAGTLTYQDVTNVDSLGIGTFRTGINVSGGQLDVGSNIKIGNAGVITATSFSGSGANLTGLNSDVVSDTSPQLGGNLDVNTKNIVFGDSAGATDDRLTFGAGTDLSIYHQASNNTSYLLNTSTDLTFMTSGTNVNIKSDTGETLAKFVKDGAVEMYHDNTKVFETIATGAKLQKSGEVNLLLGSTNAGGVYLTLDGDANGDGAGGDFAYLNHNTAGAFRIINGANNSIDFHTNNTVRWYFYNTGHFIPAVNNTYDIGSSSYRVRNIYTNDLNLSNEGSTNSVDNTWGNYTIQEGESDLFLINNRNGKKYKFNLTEVS